MKKLIKSKKNDIFPEKIEKKSKKSKVGSKLKKKSVSTERRFRAFLKKHGSKKRQ
jgi:hypothetical protein